MAQRQLPGLGLTGFWDLGYRPWKDENDANLRIISALLGMQALDLVSATPGSPADGDIYLFDETHPTNPNDLAIRDAGAWVYVTPLEGAIMYDLSAGFHRTFNATEWIALATGGGGGSLPAGGATNELLAKASGADGDADWLFLVDDDPALTADSDSRLATQKAVRAYVATMVTGLLDFKGSTDCSANPNYPAALKGDAYLVSVSGKIGGASGVDVEAGDVFIAAADNVGGTQAGVGASWFILEHNISGSGVGLPAGGTTGQVLTKQSGSDYDVDWETPSGGGGGGGYEAGPPTQPVIANFSWLRQGTSTASDGAKNLVLTPQPDDTVRGFIQTAPGGNFTVYCRAEDIWNTTNTTNTVTSYAGIIIRNSTATRLAYFAIANFNATATQSNFYRRLNMTGDGSTVNAAGTPKTLPYQMKWIKVEYDGTNLVASVSPDGFDWVQMESVTIASFLTAAGGTLSDIGFGARSSANSTPAQFYSYFSTTPPV